MIADVTTMNTHYADEANMGKLRAPPTDTKVKMQLPRMTVVPLALVPFLLEQPRLPTKFYGRLAGKIAQADTTGQSLRRDDYNMLLKWCLAATQTE